MAKGNKKIAEVFDNIIGTFSLGRKKYCWGHGWNHESDSIL